MCRFDVPFIDKLIGLYCWVTDYPAIEGNIRNKYEDFIVEEILSDGTILSLHNPKLKPSGYEGLFTHFILIKKGISNFDAAMILANNLHIPLSYIFYSGNKDRDAITVQRMAVWGVPPNTLLTIKLPHNLRITSPIRELRRIHVGDHKGNRFTITIRNIPMTERETLETILNNLRNQLIPNFFGYQRFGLIRPITHLIGKLLIMRRYREAILTYLASPSLVDDEKLLEIKAEILRGNYRFAYKRLSTWGMRHEKEILRNILRYDGNWIKIIKKIPSFLLRLFVEAYQGYIFNKTLSVLIREIGYENIKKEDIKTVPLVGYNTKINTANRIISPIIREILKNENLNLNLFKNKRFPPLTTRGGQRSIFLKPYFEEIEILDERNKLHVKLKFQLGKGQYATIVIREILKQNMIEAQIKRKENTINRQIIQRNLDNLIKFLNEMNINLVIE